ncbi:hypothetical protein M9H77_04609 [Catharanthus roseus]|uniref:Uncharacterized protein n=1 Tax=Catharanthus roseus TaxID=4058 RepID=A0ACC0CF50_CATRO|nr:hypothetical protein M9H77_04609 [Catharanthus roseus]
MWLSIELKGEQMTTSENWQLSVHDGRHSYKIGVYTHGHAQAARLTEEQLKQIEQFRKSHVPPHNILRFLQEQNISCAVRVWTSQVLYFGVETTNRAESEHSVLKLWLSICHGDLDTVFLNIDSIIESQIADVKSSLEFSKLKEKKIGKSSESGSGSGSCFGSRSGLDSCGRGRPPQVPWGKGLGRSSGRSSLSSVIDHLPLPHSRTSMHSPVLCIRSLRTGRM